MSFDPVLLSGPVLVLHTCAALVALVAGSVAIWRCRRDLAHRAAGYLWVAAMARVIQLITEFRTCDLPNVLALGGPGHATGVPSRFADRRAFPGLSRNEGPAASWVLLMIVLALPVAFLWLPGRRDGGSPGQANPIQRNLAKVGRQAHPLRSSPAPVPGQS